MARARPVRTAEPVPAVGRIDNRGAGRTLPPGAPPLPRRCWRGGATSCLLGFEPAAEQPADLAHHAARMRVLPVAQPAPAMSEPQKDAQAPERRIGVAQRRQSAPAGPRLGSGQRLLQVERRIHQPLGDGGT